MLVDLIYNEVENRYEASYPSIGTAIILSSSLSGETLLASPTITGQILGADGTSGLPFYSFTSEPTLGLWRNGAGNVSLQGALTTTGLILSGGNNAVGTTFAFTVTGRSRFESPAAGVWTMANNGATIGSNFKVDALPTVSSGFGTSPAITAGSTALAGSINVGTGGVATTGVILFNGTAFPSTPFVAITCSLGAVPTVVVATTTQLTLTTSTAWPASTIVNWICISAK